jgi:peptidoglycan hydrolase-like protein with peptidoglycan-binding domain
MEILNVQAMLANAGYYTGELDGYYGPQMNRAMRVIELTTQKHQYPKKLFTLGD